MSINTLKAGSLFSGIGGIDLAFKKIGFDIEWANEIDEKACETYTKNLEHNLICDDIKNLEPRKLSNIDILFAGFPCQAFSIAGYREAFNDRKGRGNLFFDLLSIISAKKPKVFLLENVKNLNSKTMSSVYSKMKTSLEKLGYYVTEKVMNSMSYGNIPQNRERLYIVGFKNKKYFTKFKFPEKIPLTTKVKDFLDLDVDRKYYYEGKPLYEKIKNDINSPDFVYQWRRKYVRKNKNKVCPTLTANMGTGGHNVPIIKDSKGIRKLTPRECFRLQGFPDSFIFPKHANSTLYKQVGNSVSIPVIEKLAQNILLTLKGKYV